MKLLCYSILIKRKTTVTKKNVKRENEIYKIRVYLCSFLFSLIFLDFNCEIRFMSLFLEIIQFSIAILSFLLLFLVGKRINEIKVFNILRIPTYTFNGRRYQPSHCDFIYWLCCKIHRFF